MELVTIWACAVTVVGALTCFLLTMLLRIVVALREDLKEMKDCIKGKLPMSLFYAHYHDERNNVAFNWGKRDG